MSILQGNSATHPLGKGTQPYLQLTAKSNKKVLHVLAQLHLYVRSRFVHNSVHILAKCVFNSSLQSSYLSCALLVQYDSTSVKNNYGKSSEGRI